MNNKRNPNALRLQAIQQGLNRILDGRIPDLTTASGRVEFADMLERLAEPGPQEKPTTVEVSATTTDNPYLALIGDNADLLPAVVQAEEAALVYLDPPYNTGKDMMYADRFGTKKPWAELILNTLEYSRQMLASHGVVCISLDENEISALRLLADGVFGADNFVAEFVWETKRAARGVPPRNLLMCNHEYVVCYAKNKNEVKLNGLPRETSDFHNPDNDPRGPWRSESMKATGRGGATYTICDPNTGRTFTSAWAFAESTMAQKIHDGLVLFPTTDNGTPRQKKHLTAYRNARKAGTTSLGWFSTERATKDLIDIFDGVKVFPFPKPVALLRYLIEQFTQPGELIVDPFAGSGSTGQAVMEVNAATAAAATRTAATQTAATPTVSMPAPAVHAPRRCVLIQRPERCPAQWPAAQAGFQTIAEIMVQRLARVAENHHQPAWTIKTPTGRAATADTAE